MRAFIARDGQELGEFSRQQVEQLARLGELFPTDYFWEEGMENWILLEELLAPDVWQKPPPPWSLKQKLIVTGISVGVIILSGLLAIRWSTAGGAGAPLPTRYQVAPIAPPDMSLDPAAEKDRREKAIGELRRKLEGLPGRAAAPLFVFYYDVGVEMRRSLASNVAYEATIHGSENTVDPKTEGATKRAAFELKAEYRNGEWTFKHYKAQIQNVDKPEASEEEADEKTVTPPLLVTLLGLRTPGPAQTPPPR